MERFIPESSRVAPSVAGIGRFAVESAVSPSTASPISLIGPEQQRSRSGREAPSAERPARAALPHDENSTRAAACVRCIACLTPLADTADATRVDGHHHHSFVNPHGFIYRIRCYAAARNVSMHGTPSDAFTWFRGFTWTIIDCTACATHVGWRFEGTASTFFALIADKVTSDDAPTAN
jgi:hypothetical protein